MCFDKATALCDILYKRLRNILTYLLTYQRYQPHRPKVRLRTWFSSADGEDKDGGAATISGSGLVKRGGRRAEDRKDRRRCRMQT